MWSCHSRYKQFFYEVVWFNPPKWRAGVANGGCIEEAFKNVTDVLQVAGSLPPQMVRLHGKEEAGIFELGAVATLPRDLVSWQGIPISN